MAKGSNPGRPIGLGALLVAAVVAAGGAAGTDARAALPVGAAEGVRVVRVHDAVTVVYTPRAAASYRFIAGRRVTVACTSDASLENPGLTGTGGGLESLVAPRDRRRLRTHIAIDDLDFCQVWLPERRTGPATSVAEIPLTQTGAVYLDERTKARQLRSILEHAVGTIGDRSPRRHPEPAEPLDFMRRPADVVALASPSETPPAGALGYWSDGGRHAAAVTRSATGRRLFVEERPDGEWRTNVLGYLLEREEEVLDL